MRQLIFTTILIIVGPFTAWLYLKGADYVARRATIRRRLIAA